MGLPGVKRCLTAAGAAAIGLSLALPAAAAPVKFDFWFGLSGDLERVVQQMCKNFNESQKDYEVACTSQGNYDATLQNTIAAFRAGKQPAIVQVYDAGTATMMLSGAYYPAGKLMEENGYKIDWNDYFPGIARYYATSKGELLSFPFNSSTALLYWNKDSFAKIGKTEAPKTWEEAAEDMKALKTAGYECPMAINISNNESWQLMEQFSAIHDQPIATENNGYDGLNARLTVNKTKFVKYVTDLKSWYDQGLVKIKAKEQGQDMVQAFASGDCQMIMTSVGDHGTVGKTQKAGMNWDVAELPVYAGTERKNSLVGGASLWVLQGKSKDEYKAAAAFLNFVHDPKTALFWSTNTGYIPVTKSGFDYMKSTGFYDKAPYKGREVAIASLTASEPTPITRGIRLGNFTQIRAEFGNQMQAIFSNKIGVQEGIDTLVKNGNANLERFEQTYKGKTLP
ncbi:extracellular solute-binding protein [Rhizobium tumorigenes]|uniref:extracellular solute-binding protein n=1 Tax=Rhizobium tumorigenes TaxID=2041385 RepID=UPI00241DE2BF|nr:extracellular solute-binding protein [Rhizobium tumorigenes]WFS03031.1 extracellular solute-binding protein [Rhizobium tumorigenes]